MKTKGFKVTTSIIISLGFLCLAICAWQTANLISNQSVFQAEHPQYVTHSWVLLGLSGALTALACCQAIIACGMASSVKSAGLCSVLSIGMMVLEVLTLRAAATQLYNLGMLVSDYGIRFPFDGGWLLMALVILFIIAAMAQLLIILFSWLAKRAEA